MACMRGTRENTLCLQRGYSDTSGELHWKIHFIGTGRGRAAVAASAAATGLGVGPGPAPTSTGNDSSHEKEATRVVDGRLHEYAGSGRERLMKCIAICNEKLKWKPRLCGARMNMRAEPGRCTKVTSYALREAANKNKAQVLVEFSRLEELKGDGCSQSYLTRAPPRRAVAGQKWQGSGRRGHRGRLDGRWRLFVLGVTAP